MTQTWSSYLELRLGGLLVDLPGVVAADALGLLQLALGQLPDTRQPFPGYSHVLQNSSQGNKVFNSIF